ncbi:LuxR C-terminal-related transcriptional regulator [Larkinella rosea]|uniref:LuxR C-terminal-related transcriptional regulator n=1 Tax=Larkinella rosea TaxID=2025312 RepID=UPI001639C353|nr:response regulator transcription factor [Larkinella rosea]
MKNPSTKLLPYIILVKDKIKVLLLDDHKVVIDGLLSLLRDDPQIEIEAVFTNGEEALQFMRNGTSKEPIVDVAIADLRMRRGISGLEFAVQVRSIAPKTRVIILSMSEDAKDIHAAVRLGVSGYLFKSQDVDLVRKAIHEVMRDDRPYMSQEVLRTFVDSQEEKQPEQIRQLTSREIEVLRLIAQEFTTAEIADKLNISEATVDTHRRNMIQKLKVKSIVGLANFAIRNGLV